MNLRGKKAKVEGYGNEIFSIVEKKASGFGYAEVELKDENGRYLLHIPESKVILIPEPISVSQFMEMALQQIKDCKSYNFGMRNADQLAHNTVPALWGAMHAVLQTHYQVAWSTSEHQVGDCYECMVKYPCTTVEVIEKALNEGRDETLGNLG